jgi:hypothetical protein
MPPRFIYRSEILAALEGHGVRPRETTSPVLVKDYVNDLYRYEIRRLKARLLRGEFPQSEYFGRVVLLRRRYPVLSVAVSQWTF